MKFTFALLCLIAVVQPGVAAQEPVWPQFNSKQESDLLQFLPPISGSPERVLRSSGKSALTWKEYPFNELFVQGAPTFYQDINKYAIKPIFPRGHFSIAKGKYVSIPTLYLIDITREQMGLEAKIDISEPYETTFTGTSGKKFKLKVEEDKITISSPGLFSKTLFEMKFSQIADMWRANADRYKGDTKQLFGKAIFFVPQWRQVFIKTQYNQIGYVVNENGPADQLTKYPADFIPLCYATEGNISCPAVRYSIPLGLKFIYTGNPSVHEDSEFFRWQIVEMTNEDLSDALDDEAAAL